MVGKTLQNQGETRENFTKRKTTWKEPSTGRTLKELGRSKDNMERTQHRKNMKTKQNKREYGENQAQVNH